MNKHLIKNFIFGAMSFAMMYGFVACNKDALSTSTTTLDALADQSLFNLEQRGNLGVHGCYDLVFPVSVKLEDGTVITATSQDSLRNAFKAYHAAHEGLGRGHHPTFVLPIQVIAEDGSIIDVQSESELLALRMACHKNHLDSLCHRDSMDHKGFPRHDTLCFTIVFPIKVAKADGTVITINSFSELQTQTVNEHHMGGGHGMKHGVKDQFQLVFPVTVKKADGTTTTVNSKEELGALRDQC
jgi:hypothetical protein